MEQQFKTGDCIAVPENFDDFIKIHQYLEDIGQHLLYPTEYRKKQGYFEYKYLRYDGHSWAGNLELSHNQIYITNLFPKQEPHYEAY